MSRMWSGILFALELQVYVFGSEIWCNSFEECSGSRWDNSGSGRLIADGFKSGWNDETSIILTGSSNDAIIEGDSSCREINELSVDGDIWISGSLGVYGGKITKSDKIYARSAGSIADGTVTVTTEVHCEAEMSCSGTIIRADSSSSSSELTINGDGSMSLKDSIINSNGRNITINLNGAFAGYGSLINCNFGDLCTINCNDGNGCYGLILNCVDANDCIINGCDDTILDGILCPKMIDDDDEFIPDGDIECNKYYVDIIEILDREIDFCDELFSKDEYNSGIGLSDDIIRINDNGNICCRGSESCSSQLGNYSILMGNNTSNFDSGNILCNGKRSCMSSEINNINRNYGDIYCTSVEGCKFSLINSNSNNNINGNIYCSGKISCVESRINFVENVYCSSEGACRNGIINSVSNIYITGRLGGENLLINSNGTGIMNVYLLSPKAARNAHIYCNNNDKCNIFCLTDKSCDQLTIYQCNNNINVDCSGIGVNQCNPTINQGGLHHCQNTTESPTSSVTPSPSPALTSLYCYEYEECSGTISTDERLRAYGYKSAWGSKTNISINSSGVADAWIDGDSACREIGELSVEGTQSIWATGSLSIYKGKITKSTRIHAVGAGSIADGVVTVTRQVHCDGAMSCSGTIINADDSLTNDDELTINGSGSMSLKNSIINSNGKKIIINLYGAFAGYGSLINCGESGNASCRINCYNNGCYGLTLNCIDENYCDINCDDDTYGICPNGSDLIKCDDYQVDLISILDLQSDFCDNSIESITMDNYTGNGLNSSIVKTSDGNVCCRSVFSCRSFDTVKEIRIGNNNSTSNFDGGNLMCNGWYSCYNIELDNRGIEYGNIYCNGEYSCGYGAIIHSNSNGNVHCSGDSSCRNNVIVNAKNVYCSGYFGCIWTVINNTQNIYITGHVAGYGAEINSNGIDRMNIYVLSRASYYSFVMMVINCNEGDECILFCLSNKACEYVEINGCDNIYIDCDDDDYVCPTINNNYTCKVPTSPPTPRPTPMPTPIPTPIPTYP